MRLLIGTLFALRRRRASSASALTYFALTRGAAFGALSIGSLDRLAENRHRRHRSLRARRDRAQRRLPIALGDGVSFTAPADDDGKLLDGRCDVVLTGITPAARFWTLTLYNRGRRAGRQFGRPLRLHQPGNRAQAPTALSRSTVAPRASPGNWLPTGGVERYVLVLRLYDTAVGVSTKAGREVPMPASIKSAGSCP